MTSPVNIISSLFAEHVDTIRMLYLVDENFKALCDDYYRSLSDIDRLKEKILENRRDEMEYKHLSLVLEKEILDYIKKLE